MSDATTKRPGSNRLCEMCGRIVATMSGGFGSPKRIKRTGAYGGVVNGRYRCRECLDD